MHLRYWAGFGGFSTLLHLVFFWPMPAPSSKVDNLRPLIVSLPNVSSADVRADAESIAVETHYSASKEHPRVEEPPARIQPKTVLEKSAGVKTEINLAQQGALTGVEPKEAQLKDAIDLLGGVSINDLSPSVSRYRLALAAEVIRSRALVERFAAPEFKGKLVVLVQFHGPNAAPQVSLDEAAGLAQLDREVLAVFKRAAEVVPVSIAGDVGEVVIRLPVHFD